MSPSVNFLVTFLAPMKRGLKESARVREALSESYVTFLAPMKRGLKGGAIGDYEDRIKVTFLAPMKRGLKESIHERLHADLHSNIPCPDEKGTESLMTLPC